jgi:hypothetical protein
MWEMGIRKVESTGKVKERQKRIGNGNSYKEARNAEV